MHQQMSIYVQVEASEKLYEDLQKAVSGVPKQDMILIMRDLM